MRPSGEIKENGRKVGRDGECNGNEKEYGKYAKLGQHASMIFHMDHYVA
jgi:hypothetical protein